MAGKHISVATWLEALGLLEYLPLFRAYGGVEELLNIHEAEVRQLGVKNSAHRAKIISSLRILRDKYQKGKHTHHIDHLRKEKYEYYPASPQISPPSPFIHPDYQLVGVPPERLAVDLNNELHADPSELKSRPWYHGNISRQHAEGLVLNDGDYLVRDCISRPGDFVLTCCWRGTPLHFMINAFVGDSLLGSLPKITYQFEEESFNSIQDLILYYETNQKSVTSSSAAVLKHPVPRSMPLSYYDAKYGALLGFASIGHYSVQPSPRNSPVTTPTGSPSGSPKMNRRTPRRAGSQPLLSLDDDDNIDRSRSPSIDRYDSLPMINTPRSEPAGKKKVHVYHQRSGSAPVTPSSGGTTPVIMLTPAGSETSLHKAPPPKPSRIPSIKYKRKPVVVVRREISEEDGRDYTDYSQVKEDPSWLKKELGASSEKRFPVGNSSSRQQNIYDNNFNKLSQNYNVSSSTVAAGSSVLAKSPRERLFSDTRFSVIDQRSPESPKENAVDEYETSSIIYDLHHLKTRKITIPHIKSKLSVNLADFTSTMIAKDNKPLEASSLIAVKSYLLEENVKNLAQHITKVDLEVLQVLLEQDLGVGVQSGLELITLPHGKQLRQYIIERCHCMKLIVMVTILTCSSVIERAKMLSQWIETARELKQTMGNLFGFTNVMEGLLSDKIQRLSNTLLMLRKNHTNSAYTLDTKLRPAFHSMNDGTSELPLQNVSIPHIGPIVHLLERDLDDVLSLMSWEEEDSNYGLDIMLSHLDVARIIASQFGLYRINGSSVLSEMKENPELVDVFRTEFHMRLLWGMKGCGVNRRDRHTKFEQLLMILSNRAEPPNDEGTAV
ncbi:SH2 domain-containing protein 3C-like [Gigantopelta aegis]|uniref:SH2 domain-containing protein 3C-like n=1 Tax=Gigantopelta aegis TaxID=1735272 RepID=UPI001B88BB24|nr:SH2 domain-containing protein 3C-like [Gigantopelta aegis]XP_041368186.1 SH2 domain-containing protein 3C-like [Gigantopelta aegis]